MSYRIWSKTESCAAKFFKFNCVFFLYFWLFLLDCGKLWKVKIRKEFYVTCLRTNWEEPVDRENWLTPTKLVAKLSLLRRAGKKSDPGNEVSHTLRIKWVSKLRWRLLQDSLLLSMELMIIIDHQKDYVRCTHKWLIFSWFVLILVVNPLEKYVICKTNSYF